MKLVSSAKLRKAQQAVETMRPYQYELEKILALLASVDAAPASAAAGKTAIVAIASNSSLCGAFNGNVVRKVQSLIDSLGSDKVELVAIGRKVAEPLRKSGAGRPLTSATATLGPAQKTASAAAGPAAAPASVDLNRLVAHPDYATAQALADGLLAACAEGRYSQVLLVYNHFVSTGSQKVVVESLLGATGQGLATPASEAFILEPGREEILRDLVPQVRRLKLFAAILDSIAAEHAARMIAMQAASDNAEDLLAELSLEYNKGRQAKITAEILDLVGGAQQ